MRETAGLGEQAINKIAEMALASQLHDAGELEVRIKLDFNKLARGEVESIAIKIAGLLMQANLRLEELQLQINRVTVKPFSALFGKIELTHPCDGNVRAVINEDSLSHALNTQSTQKSRHNQGFAERKISGIHIQQLRCFFLADGHIVFNCQAILEKTNQAQSVTFTALPSIGMDGRKIVLQQVRDVEGKEPPPELVAALVAQASEILSLPEFEEKGMSLQFQELDMAAGKLTWQAAAHIEQFPSG
ncbi:MAG: DUF2993 domain-containing protein [Microcoleus vaginatus WJT46-NPBG5]|jgi:hypothetical protein|nr:DUF2993 domain-containing protein [Microcoleus vaginatus WJT46-NPBG5]